MLRVRHAGHLVEEENKREKSYWCVIRNGLFLAYALNNETTCDIDIGDEPARVFPISHLSATAFILPSHKKAPTQYALELHCAESGQRVMFYTDRREALEIWVDAIKAESSSDQLDCFDSTQGELLPPELGVVSAGHLDENPANFLYDDTEFERSKSPESNLQFASAFGKKQLSKSDLFSSINAETKRTKSPFKPDTSHGKGQSFVPRSSPIFYRDSTSGSSITSSPIMTSSPIPNHQPILTPNNRTSNNENKAWQEMKVQSTYDEKHQPKPSFKLSQEHPSKNPYFYIREQSNPVFKKQGTANSPSERIRKSKVAKNSPAKRSARHTIAPISNLDLQINQRQRTSKAADFHLISKQQDSSDTDDSDSDNSSIEETNNINESFQSESVNSILSDISSNNHYENEENNNIPTSGPTKKEGTKTPVHKIKEKLKSNENLKKNNSFLRPQDDEQRKRSGSIGSRILNRAKSAVGKRNSRSIELPDSKQESRDVKSVDDKDDHRIKNKENTKRVPMTTIKLPHNGNSPGNGQERIIVNSGWLYRRKRVTWNRVWAVLEANKILFLYKSEPISDEAMPVSRFELLRGCEVANVVQSKGNSTFVLNFRKQFNEFDNANTQDNFQSVQFMCKNNQDFTYWMKAFHMVNSIADDVIPNHVIKPVLTLRPISKKASTEDENESPKKLENSETEVSGKESTELANKISNSHTNKAKVRAIENSAAPCNHTIQSVASSGEETFLEGAKRFDSMEFDLGFIDDVSTASFGTRHSVSHSIDSIEQNIDDNAGAADELFQGLPKSVNNNSDDVVNSKGQPDSDATWNNTNIPTSLLSTCQVADTSNKDNLLPHNSSSLDQVHKSLSNHNDAIKVGLSRTRELDNCVRNRALTDDVLLRDKFIENSSRQQTNDPSVRSSVDKRRSPFSFRAPIQKQENVEYSNTFESPGSKSTAAQKHLAKRKVKQVGDRIESDYDVASDIVKNSEIGSTKTFDNPKGNSQYSSINNFTRIKLVSRSRYIDALDLANISRTTIDEHLYSSIDNKGNILNNNKLTEETLKRSLSDCNLLEPFGEHKIYRMRNLGKAVPELTEIDFIEIYGLTQRNSKLDNQNINKNANIDDNSSIEERNVDLIEKDYLNKHSFGDESSEDSHQARTTDSIASTASSVTSSTGSGLSESSKKRSSWFKSVKFSLKRATSSVEHGKKQTVLDVPAVQLSTSSHRGYLDLRNKKKQWERFFCVLRDACLYCYNTPQSQTTCDVILLRGYDVIADVTNMNRSRFSFRLEQHGFQTIHLSTDNHEEFVLWVATLEQETRRVVDRNGNKTVQDNTVVKQTVENNPTRNTWTKSLSSNEVEQQLVELQKHKLLQEIAVQQQSILKEQILLDTKESVRATQEPTNLRSSRQNDVIEKFEQSRHEEVVKMIKHMTQLNTRRNSAQLKVDQLSKEIGPRSGKKRRQNHQHFAALESRLNSMKQRLYEIDVEIREQQESKTNVLEKNRERQELELLVTEQQESLDILKSNRNRTPANRKRHQVTPRPRDHLTSIEELSSLSDSSNSSGSLDVERVRQAMSTPLQMRISLPVAFEVNSCDSLPSIDLMRSNLTRSEDDLSSLRHHNSLSDVIASSSMSRGDSKSSIECEKSTNDVIDPDVLAQIEMFEMFSKNTLAKVHKHH